MYTQPKTIRKFDGKLYLKVFLLALIVSLTFFSPFLLGDRGLFLFYGDYNVQQIPSPQNLSESGLRTLAHLLYFKITVKSTQKTGFFQLLQYNNKKSQSMEKFVKNAEKGMPIQSRKEKN